MPRIVNDKLNNNLQLESITRKFVICKGIIMKKIYKIGFSILLILILTITILIAYQVTNTEQYIYKEESPYTVSGFMTQGFVEDSVEAINCIPTTLLIQFVNDGWNFVICNTDQAYFGLCDMNNKIIFVYYQQHDGNHTVEDTVLHEFGHYMDQKLGMLSNTEEFRRLFKVREYVDNSRLDEYCYKNRQELFATLFRDYILHNNYLKSYIEYYDFISLEISK